MSDIFNDLFEEYYPKENSYIYFKKLQEIKQGNFYWIQDYVEIINKEIINLSIASKLNRKEMQNKFDEIFVSGLSIETRIEMVRLKLLGDTQKIINHIVEVENVFKNNISLEEKKESTIRFTNNRKNYKTKNIKDETESKYKTEWFKKWCKFCRSETHNTRSCYKLKNRQKDLDNHYKLNKNDKDNEKTQENSKKKLHFTK